MIKLRRYQLNSYLTDAIGTKYNFCDRRRATDRLSYKWYLRQDTINYLGLPSSQIMINYIREKNVILDIIKGRIKNIILQHLPRDFGPNIEVKLLKDWRGGVTLRVLTPYIHPRRY